MSVEKGPEPHLGFLSKQLFRDVVDIIEKKGIPFESLQWRPKQETLRLLSDTFSEICPVPSEELKERVEREVLSYGPLSPLIEAENQREIIVTGVDQIWIEGLEGTMKKTQETFLSKQSFHAIVQKICSEAHLDLNLNRPALDGHWRGFRLHIVQAPLLKGEFQFCLRGQPPEPRNIKDLESSNWAPPEALELISKWVNQKKNLLIIGTTGSGKTSLLNTVLTLLPANERCLLIEDTEELRAPNEISAKLKTRISEVDTLKNYELQDLVKESLRMRPDRIILGEVRGSEAKDLLLALSTGHKGSLSTLHADSAQQALIRLEMLIQMGAPQWSLESIRRLIHLSLDGIIEVEKKNGKRQLKALRKIGSLESFGFTLETLFSLEHPNSSPGESVQNLQEKDRPLHLKSEQGRTYYL